MLLLTIYYNFLVWVMHGVCSYSCGRSEVMRVVVFDVELINELISLQESLT